MSLIDELKTHKPPADAVKPEEIAFWYLKDDTDPRINTKEFLDLLEALGFARLDDGLQRRFIRIERGSIATETDRQGMIDGVFKFLAGVDELRTPKASIKPLQIARHLLDNLPKVFQEDKLHRLRQPAGSFLQDDPHTKWMFFKNGFLKITAKGQEFRPYAELPGLVWADRMLPHEYHAQAGAAGPFLDFLRNITSTAQRLEALQTWMGYYVHTFTGTVRKALILTDAAMGADKEANGGTGKSLFARCLAIAMSSNPDRDGVVADINGKDFDPHDRFKYQGADRNTALIVVNDLKHNFDLRNLYNDITEGTTVQHKGLTSFKINSKMLLTTNATLDISGQSSERRFTEFEFAAFYNAGRTPFDVHGHWFFTDWSPAQWAQFYNQIVHCVRLWLAAGKLPKVEPINLSARKLIEQTCKEFVEWAETFDWLINDPVPGPREQTRWHLKHELFNNFQSSYPGYFAKLSIRRFTAWLVLWTRLRPELKAHDEKADTYRSNSDHYFCLRRAK